MAPERRPSAARREASRPAWESPWLTALLAAVLAGLLVVVLQPRLPDPLAGLPTNPPGTPVAASAGPTPRPTFVRPTPTPRPTFTVWVVQSGDSLNSIARRFSTTARSIAFWNREAYPTLDPYSEAYAPGRIRIGWRLSVIPGAIYDEDLEPEPPGGPSSGPSEAPA